MNFWKRLIPRSQGATIRNVTVEQLNDIYRGYPSDGNINVNERSALSIATVYRCVDIVSSSIAQFPLDIIRKVSEGERQIVTDHPVAMAFNRKPNEWLDRYQFRRLIMTHLLLRGNFYALIVRSPRVNGPLTLEPFNPDQVEPRMRDNRRLEYEVTSSNGTRRVYQQSQIFHLRGMSYDGIKGLSVIAAARQDFSRALEAQAARGRYYRQGTFAGYALEVSEKMNAETRKALREHIREQGGLQNTGTPPILEMGTKIVNLGMNAQDAEFIASLGFQTREIARWFGVPSHMLNDTEKTTSWGSGIEQLSIGFVAFTLQNWIETLEAGIEFQLFRESESSLQVKINPAALVRGDQKTQAAVFASHVQNGILSRNEARELLDRPPYEDGDAFLTPANLGVNTSLTNEDSTDEN